MEKELVQQTLAARRVAPPGSIRSLKIVRFSAKEINV
jgi:hypothetical protein